ncbi:uncharacterized protein LOC125952708 [Anopheles darlingi]|uniref:uncharacterized protein LOC125952708 n=1 Tax=Anopheles darlingi TaxID=43151 RepID=UPI0021002F60|nr:uncharacterized protein LOC125952708 [Anopheles darlingi]
MRSPVLVCLMALAAFSVCLMSVVQANPIESSSAVPVPTGVESIPPEEVTTDGSSSKMSKFLDDFTSAFKQGTAKMKESLESAASSVKDGVLQGYDYVRSKLLTGDRPESPPPAPVVEPDQEQEQEQEDADATPITSTQAAGLTSPALKPPSTPAVVAAAPARPSITSSSSNGEPEQVSFGGGGAGGAGVVGAIGIAHEPAQIVPNDDGADEDRIFFNDKDLEGAAAEGGTEREGTEQPVPITTTTTTATPAVDNRFILAGPLACKTGQEAVNGKCRNVF